jgi:hypothetical protein
VVNVAMTGKGFERPRKHWNAAEVGILLGQAATSSPAAPPRCDNNGYG